jgi:hypothetical protein
MIDGRSIGTPDLAGVDLGAEPPEHGGQEGERCGRTASTESMMPSAMLRKAGLGTSSTADSDRSTVRALKATALPAVAIVSSTESTMAALSPGSTPRRCRAARKRTTRNRALVDPQGQGEHESEVESPDRHGRDVVG